MEEKLRYEFPEPLTIPQFACGSGDISRTLPRRKSSDPFFVPSPMARLDTTTRLMGTSLSFGGAGSVKA
jgi:hypothetical protein